MTPIRNIPSRWHNALIGLLSKIDISPIVIEFALAALLIVYTFHLINHYIFLFFAAYHHPQVLLPANWLIFVVLFLFLVGSVLSIAKRHLLSQRLFAQAQYITWYVIGFAACLVLDLIFTKSLFQEFFKSFKFFLLALTALHILIHRNNVASAHLYTLNPKVSRFLVKLFSRKSLLVLLLVLIVTSGVSLRFRVINHFGYRDAAPSMVWRLFDLASNLLEGKGYMIALSPEIENHYQHVKRVLTYPEVERYRLEEDGEIPSAYSIMPGYVLFVATLWSLAGTRSNEVILVTQALLDGLLAPLLLFFILRTIGFRIGALVASCLYTVFFPRPLAVPGIYVSLFLPDSLTPLLSLLIVFALVLFYYRGRIVLSCLAGAALLSIACYFRGEFILLLFLLVPCFLFNRNLSVPMRLKTASLFLCTWIVLCLPLSIFYYKTLGRAALTRAGSGLLLWEGLGQKQPNPWGITIPEGGNIDTAAGNLLKKSGLRYGTYEGDRLLLREFFKNVRQEPIFFLRTVFDRMMRVTFGLRPGWGLCTFIKSHVLVYTLFIVLSAVGFWLARSRLFFTAVLLMLFVSRAFPFYLMRDEYRFVTPIYLVYIVGFSVLADRLIDYLMNATESRQAPKSASGAAPDSRV